jgi:hypothetical protein
MIVLKLTCFEIKIFESKIKITLGIAKYLQYTISDSQKWLRIMRIKG